MHSFFIDKMYICNNIFLLEFRNERMNFLYKILIPCCLLFYIQFSYGQCGLDVFVANDQSGSQDAVENVQGRHFISELMRNLDPWGNANNQSRIAIAQWDNGSSWTQYNFPIAGTNYTTNLSDVIAYQNSARFMDGGTDIYDALYNTYRAINQTPVAGRNVPQVIVLMTDTYCSQIQNGIDNLARQIKDDDIIILVMAIDSAQYCSALQGTHIASPGGYFSAPSYAQLEQRALAYVRNMISSACTLAPVFTYDLIIKLNNFTTTNCTGSQGTHKVSYTINNVGRIAYNNSITISFYNGNPALPTTRFLGKQNIGIQNIASNGSVSGSFTSALLANTGNLFAIVNFDGSLSSNAPPLPYNLKDKLIVAGEKNEQNNFSNSIVNIKDNSCSPNAVLNVNVNSGGVGCDNTVIYEVEICNTGNAAAVINDINGIAAPNFTLNNISNASDTAMQRIWSTYYGDNDDDIITDVATDKQGNVYVSGYTATVDVGAISTSGAHQYSYGGGGEDAFLVKFNKNGVRQWGTYYGGNDNDVGKAVAIDTAGNVYLSGWTLSTSSIATAGAYQPSRNVNAISDGFLVKFNSNGVRQWGTYYGGNKGDDISSMAIDAQNNIYIAGSTSSTTNIASAGAHQTVYSGDIEDGFLVKFNNNGVRQWATYYGGSNNDGVSAIGIDAQNNIFMTGYTASSNNIATAGSHQNTINGVAHDDAFLVKFNSNGVRQWGTYYGGSSAEQAHGLATDQASNVFISGVTYSTNNIATTGAHQSTLGSAMDAFLVKFNGQGVEQWGTYYGGNGDDVGYSLCTDAYGNVFMSGYTISTNNIASSNAYQTSLSGTQDGFFVKFDAHGLAKTGTYFGGSMRESAYSICVDDEGYIYIGGHSNSITGVASPGAHQTLYGGGSIGLPNDGFLAKFKDANQLVIPQNECIKRQYTYTFSSVPAGTYNYSIGIVAQKYFGADGTPIILPDSNFNAGTFTNIDGFNGANHTSDNVTITGNTAACATGDKVNVNVSIPATSGCGGGNYVQATVTINNTSGVTMFNPKLYLNLSGTGATFASELFDITNNLSIPAPNILAPTYPNVTNALYGKTGVQTLPIYQLPAGISTFKIDINLGASLTNLGVRIDSLPTIFNASGSSNLATDAQGVSIPSLPNINGFGCPAAINAGGTITFSGISTTNSASVKWASSSVASVPNNGSVSNPFLTYTPTPTDLANGFVAISLTALNSAGCDATRSCQVAINNVVFDYGDAPITYDLNKNAVPYAGSSTLLSGIHLGTTAPTTEATAKNSADAKADGVEEDGLLSSNCTSKPINLQTFPLQIKATNTTSTKAYISAFADWNNDGDYLDDGETVVKVGTVPANSNTNNYTLNFIPETANTALTQYFVRLRISTDSNSIKQPYESSPQGEIEDHIMKLGLSATYRQFVFDVCQGDSVKVNNKTYKITGTYFDTLVNSVGCDSVITVKLTVHPKYNKTQKIDLCQGGSIKVGTNTYTLSGIYTDSLKTTKNCDSVVITNLTIHPKYNVSQNIAICPGSSYTIGTHTYTQAGNYKDTLKTTLDCDSVVTTRLTFTAIITALQNITICPGSSYTIGTHTYTLAGTYKDTLKTNAGCDSVVTTTISIAALQTVSRNVSICSNEKLVIGTNTYTTNGVYKDTIKGNAGCDTLLTTTLTVYPKPVVNLGKDVLVCPDSIIALDAGNVGATYNWNNGQSTQQIQATNAATYIVTVTKNICSTNDTVIIQHKPVYKVNLGEDAILCNKDTLILNVATNQGSYIWQDGSLLPTYVVRQEGVYYVQVTTECLVSSDTISVIEEACDCQYYIPTAFSPNNDRIHDEFGVVNTCTGVTAFKLEIYNRWSALLFESMNEKIKWNGIYKDIEQPVDDYVYILTYKQNGKDYYKKGAFSLLR